jgi:dihydrolipoamide dehydrogenase
MTTPSSSSPANGRATSLAIIGCGPGGYATAEYAAKAGLQVTIFEKDELGGTCLNRGCIPTKVYCHIASVLLEGRALAAHDIVAAPGIPAFPAAFARKEAVVAQLRDGIATLMAQPGITLVHGQAQLKDAHTVTCDGKDYPADNIIIATGSHPTAPPITGLDNPHVVDSTGLLALQQLPKHLVIIGAGVIGMEMASAFNAFGTEVTVVEFLKECLPMADSDLAKRLRKQLESRGVKFYMQAAAKAISDNASADDGAVSVTFEQKGKTLTVSGDTVLCATGRGPNTEGLGLDEVGIVYDRHGIRTDDDMRTSVDSIYAIGDVNGRMQLAHAAEAQGRVVVDSIVGRESKQRLDLIPWAVFTTPELAGIALAPAKAAGGEATAKDADEGAPATETQKSFYRSNGKAVAMDATFGLVKTTYRIADGTITGCQALGAHAADIVQEVAALMNRNATIDDLDAVIHIHPTLQEIL